MTKTIQAIFDGEALRPTSPVDLEPNTSYRISIELVPADARDDSDAPEAGDPNEVAAWAAEIEAAAQAIPEEDHARFLEALSEQKHASKEQVRRQMGLA
ncbi:MAG: antitoxin family protein [bacterium]|nr:antitoxin family protein [bacterium]